MAFIFVIVIYTNFGINLHLLIKTVKSGERRLLQRLSVAIQRGNSVAVLGTLANSSYLISS